MITDSESLENSNMICTPNMLNLDLLERPERWTKVDLKMLGIYMKKNDLVNVFTVSQKLKYRLLSARVTYFR